MQEDHQEAGKRNRVMTAKGLENALEMKRKELSAAQHKLNHVMQNTETTPSENNASLIERAKSLLAYTLDEFTNLIKQTGEIDCCDDGLVKSAGELLIYSNDILKQIKHKQTDKSSVITRTSRRSKSSYTASSSSSVNSAKLRAKAAAEAAAARKNAEYKRLIAERELEQKQREAEDEIRRIRERALHERNITILDADRKLAIANAKLEAIELAVNDEDKKNNDDDLRDLASESEKRTSEWVEEQRNNCPIATHEESKPRGGPPPMPIDVPAIETSNMHPTKTANYARLPTASYTLPIPFGQPFSASTPTRDITESRIIRALTTTNQQIISGIAKQNLPKCHPDTFSGDATLFHPWKKAFKAMLSETDITPEQEINYLRKFTSGNVQRVVDNYRKRHNNPAQLLRSLWLELERRFGSPSVITNVLLERLRESANFDESDISKLQEFADICADVDSQINSLPGLACLNYPMAITPIVQRMPASLRGKWEKEIARYAEENNDAYPSFHSLAQIVKKHAILRNHPNIIAGVKPTTRRRIEPQRRTLATKFTSPTSQARSPPSTDKEKHCPFHDKDGHTLSDCKAFKVKSLQEKTEWIMKAGLCFLCLAKEHTAKYCNANKSCDICGDKRHTALLHKDKPNAQVDDHTVESLSNIATKCTVACSDNGGLTCSKIVLVDMYKKKDPNKVRRVYAVIDDQSNASLVSSELLDDLEINSPKEKYFLSTCSSNNEVKFGRKASDLVVRSIVEGREFNLPQLTECDQIPSDKREIPTPEMVRRFAHLETIASEIPPLDANANIHILLGRDAPELLKVRAFKNGPKCAPWAQKLLLGWTVSGQTCLDFTSENIHIQSRRTELIETDRVGRDPGRLLLHGEECDLVPCHNKLTVTDDIPGSVSSKLQQNVFYTRPDDNEVGLSIEDRKFLDIMENGIKKNKLGNWEMPLPFRQGDDTNMPNNRPQAVQRLNSLTKTLNRKPQVKQDYTEFMGKVISKGHASRIPNEELNAQEGRVWYLPHFGVYHPKKPTQIRVVFDSSAEFENTSLNKELLSGPDLTNNLIDVLIRFRRDKVAVMCDIEQMFHSFHVSPKHRNYLRFLWFKDNDPHQNEIVEYRMNVHLFGNGPSPAVATFGLRAAVNNSKEVSTKVKEFVNRNFYVDDGLASAPTPEQAITMVQEAQAVLATANLRLHKVASNSVEVMQAFPATDRAKDIRDLDLSTEGLPAQRSLGVYWDLENDVFTFRLTAAERPFTRRGVLSTINSVYDPLGLAAPVVINGKLFLQQIMVEKRANADDTPLRWDTPLPEKQMSQWQRWKEDLRALEDVTVPRCYQPKKFGSIRRAELHVFSDASQSAVAAAVFLQTSNQDNVSVALVYGQAKVAPTRPTSIPRLELCAAVMATQAAAKVRKELDIEVAKVVYYTDSLVVLGYIMNENKRFYVYVANRVQIIRSLSSPNEWRYIESERNPADLGTRGISATKLQQSSWLSGPDFLKRQEEIPTPLRIDIDDNDPEVRKEVTTVKTAVKRYSSYLGTERFKRFSSFNSLQRGIALLIMWLKKFKAHRSDPPQTKEVGALRPSLRDMEMATTVIVKESQQDAGIEAAEHKQNSSKTHKGVFDSLDPFMDHNGILRVGGRLRRSSMDTEEKHPVILSKDHHLSTLNVRHFHEKVHHQGRQITHAAIRQGGYWLIGGHRLISNVLHHCVICRKSRGTHVSQHMADLPADRMEEVPPFTNVGFDVFGPWNVTTRRTRGGAANSKCWGLLFTCLNSRAAHIEVLEYMDASAFICALRRFFAVRGPATLLRCDRGTNFIGGQAKLQPTDEEKIRGFVMRQGCEWKFNPPHASHFGGVWERQIGTIRRVLDAMFAELGYQQLTHELLTTLMAEVSAIVNARPIAAIPSDVDDPQPLSPQTILTMKTRPLVPPSGEFLPPDLYAKRRWRRVQYLADQFWVRWRREYLQSLQVRNKWRHKYRNLMEGDVVLFKEEGHRNNWPMGRVAEAVPSEDGLVRKANVAIVREGKKKTMLRPIKELVLLLPVEEQD